jgi:carbon starvation protein CstA
MLVGAFPLIESARAFLASVPIAASTCFIKSSGKIIVIILYYATKLPIWLILHNFSMQNKFIGIIFFIFANNACT